MAYNWSLWICDGPSSSIVLSTAWASRGCQDLLWQEPRALAVLLVQNEKHTALVPLRLRSIYPDARDPMSIAESAGPRWHAKGRSQNHRHVCAVLSPLHFLKPHRHLRRYYCTPVLCPTLSQMDHGGGGRGMAGDEAAASTNQKTESFKGWWVRRPLPLLYPGPAIYTGSLCWFARH